MKERNYPNMKEWIIQSFKNNTGREPTPKEFEEAYLSFTYFVVQEKAKELGNDIKNFKPKLHPHGSSTHIKIANILDIKAKMFRRK